MWHGIDDKELKKRWAEKLSKYSLDSIKQAIGRLEAEYPSFPPTLFEFSALCKPTDSAHPSHQMFPKLEDRTKLLVDAEAKAKFDKAREEHMRNKFPGLDWADKLRVKHAMGEKLTIAQIELYQNALKMQA